MKRKVNTPEQQQKLVDDWNANYPVGTEVRRYRYINPTSDPELQITKTRSTAWVLSGHIAVVMVEGKTGCIALKSVVATEAHSLKKLRNDKIPSLLVSS